MRLVIFVSLRMAASAVAPSALIRLPSRLRARGRVGNGERVGVSMHESKHCGGGGALEVGDLRLVDYGSQRSGALGSDFVVLETVSEGQGGNGG